MRYKWDFFIAHAGGDIDIAENLHALLKSRSKVFLDSEELILGDAWDQELAEAQRQSLITIVIVSQKTEKAYYQREEIAVAIQMARNANQKHRVIPMFMPGCNKLNVPYGLTIIHSLTLDSESDIDVAAERLLDTLKKIQKKRKGIKKTKGPNTSGLEEEIQILNRTQQTLKEQLVVFNRARVTPQDCDENIKELSAIKESSIPFFINNGSEAVTNHIMAFFKCEEDILNLISHVRHFRKISVQIDNEDTKQQIIISLQNLIKDIDSLILKIRG